LLSSSRRHTRSKRDWSSDVCSSDLEFVFQISKDEYLDLLFEDLALPNLKQNQQRQLTEYKTHRAGYTANGVPANISVVRSLQNRSEERRVGKENIYVIMQRTK